MQPARNARGRIVGTAGSGLVDAPWAANDRVARIGRLGEIRTGTLLGDLAGATGVTVLHDLHLPVPGFTANIDHVVVGGNVVLLIDTKVWKPGWYWSLGGVARRGWTRFEHARTGTPAMARDSIGRFLGRRGVAAIMPEPVVAVWASQRSGQVSVRLLRMQGCRPCRAENLVRAILRVVPKERANPNMVQVLAELVNRRDSVTAAERFAVVEDGGWGGSTRRIRPRSGSPHRTGERPNHLGGDDSDPFRWPGGPSASTR